MGARGRVSVPVDAVFLVGGGLVLVWRVAVVVDVVALVAAAAVMARFP